MSVVDDRGRLFGTINLIDLGVLLFVALLIPMGYGAYMLFRTPPPRVVAVVPSSFAFARGAEQRARVQGQYFRPALRAKLGTTSASAFSLQTPEAAEIRFSDLAPGTYDVALFDESQEVARLNAALTILPPPVQVVGRFVGPSAADDRLVRGVKLGPVDRPVELLDVDPIRADLTRRSTLRVTCVLSPDNQCLVGGTAVRPGVELKLPLPGTTNPATFVADELRADSKWLTVKVRLMGLPDALDRAHSGDIDVRSDQGSASPIAGVNTGAILLSLGPRQKNQGSYAITASRPQGGADLNAYTVLSAAVPVDAQAGELIVPVESSPAGGVYRGVPVRPGSVLPFETASYRIEVLIVSIPPS